MKWLRCFSTSPHPCAPAAPASASWPFSASFPLSSLQKVRVVPQHLVSNPRPFEKPFVWWGNEEWVHSLLCLLWVGGTSPADWLSPLWGCDPWDDPSSGEVRGDSTGVLQRRFPSLVSARDYSRVGNGAGCWLFVFFFGGGLILHGSLQGFVAQTLMLGVV